MNYVEHYLTIDLTRERVSGCIIIGERNVGHRLHVRLSEGVVPYTLPVAGEGIVQFVYELPSGSKSDAAMTVADNEAVCVIPAAALQAPGDVNCEVRVYTTAAGTWTTTAQFVLDVQDAIYDAEAMEELERDPTVYEQIVASEAGRVAAEALRVSAEEGRADAEAGRVSAEAARVLAEEARAAAEEARAAAEEARQAANYITHDEIDATPTANSENVAQSGGVYAALSGKQDALDYDSSPTLNSTKMVKSGGIYTGILKNKPLYTAVCETAAGTTPKVLMIRNAPIDLGIAGARDSIFAVMFKYGNSVSGQCALQIYGGSTTCPICLDAPTSPSSAVTGYDAKNLWADNEIVFFYFNGYNFVAMKRAATGTVPGMVKISNSTSSTAQDTAASSYALRSVKNSKQDTLTFDSTPTEHSTNPVKSGGVYAALAGKQDTLTWDTEPTAASTNALPSGKIYNALAEKANTSSLANVAMSGSYNDLTDTPTIPEAFEIYVCGTGEYNTTTGVPTLQSPDNHHLYLTPNGTSYREYVYTGTAYELVGDTTVDLSNYVQTTDLVAYTETEIANLWSAASAST